MGSSKHNKDNAKGGKSREATPQAHDGHKGGNRAGKQHKGGNRGACNYNRGGGGGGKDEIVPWGFEQAARAERKKKAAANVAAQASAKAAKEYDPANAVAQKVIKVQTGDRAGQNKSGLPPAS